MTRSIVIRNLTKRAQRRALGRPAPRRALVNCPFLADYLLMLFLWISGRMQHVDGKYQYCKSLCTGVEIAPTIEHRFGGDHAQTRQL